MFMNKLKINQCVAEFQTSGVKKRCCICKIDFGLCYEKLEKECSNSANLVQCVQTKINSKILCNRLAPRYPYKLSCGHKICNVCFDENISDKNSLGFCCPVCQKPLGKLTKHSLTASIDFEQFGRACFNSIYNQFKLNDDLNNMKTVYSNHLNQQYIKIDIDKFILKCSFCPDRLIKVSTETELILDDKAIADCFCFSCFEVYCKECFTFKHNEIGSHCKLEIDKAKISSMACQNHKKSVVRSYCFNCRTFVCSDCSIKYDHKKHTCVELFSIEARQILFQHWTSNFISFRKTNIENLEKITQDFDRLVPKDLPSNMLDKYLFRNDLVDVVTRLKENISEISQAVFIIDELLKVLEFFTLNCNNILLHRTIDDFDLTIKSVLNEYGRLTTFDCYKPVEINEKKLIAIEQIQQEEATTSQTIDLNNNMNIDKNLNKTFNNAADITNKYKKLSTLKNSISCQEFDLKASKFVNKTNLVKEKNSEITDFKSLEGSESNSESTTSKLAINESKPLIQINKSEYLEVDKNYMAKLVGFKNPSDFWIRLSAGDEINKLLTVKIKKMYQLEDVKDYLTEMEVNEIAIGDRVAYYSEAKTLEMWVRAEIIDVALNSMNEKIVEVLCYDWGVVETVLAKKLKKLHPTLLNEPKTAFHCYVNNLKPYENTPEDDDNVDDKNNDKVILNKKNDKWYDGIWHNVFQWARTKTLKLKVRKIDDNDHYGVDLSDKRGDEMISSSLTYQVAYSYHIESIILSEMLVRCKMCQFIQTPPNFKMNKIDLIDAPHYIPMKPLCIGEKLIGGISIFYSLKDFTMKRLYDDSDSDNSLFKLDTKMQAEYNSPTNVEFKIFEPFIGMPVAALFNEDNRWYRAEVISIQSKFSHVTVYFMDYGNIEKCDIGDLRYLKPEFFIEEISIFRCRLYGIKFLDEENYNKAANYFYQTTYSICKSNEKTMQVNIKDVIDDGDNKTLSIKSSRIHEVIIRYPIDGKLTNINVLFTKLGYAEPTSLSIFDGEKEKNNIDDVAIKNKIVEPKFDKEVLEVSMLPNKKFRDITDEHKVLCKVINAICPSEIWVQDVVDSENCYQKFQKILNEKYIEMLKTLDLTSTEWDIGDLCVLKTNRKKDYLRAKIVEKFPTGNYKLICLDTGYYESNVKPEHFLELIEEFREKPDFKAKKCSLIGVQPTGTSNGFWSSLAKTYTSETLNDHFVHVVFKSDRKEDESYDTVIYIDVSEKPNVRSNAILPDPEPKLIRFAEMLNAKGLAFLTEKKVPIDNLLARNSQFQSSSSLLTLSYELQVYLDSKLPKEILNEYLNNKSKHPITYDCIVTNVDTKTGLTYIRFLNPYQTFETTKMIHKDLESFFNSNNPEKDISYTANFIRDVLKKNQNQACVCKFKDNKYYRCEIIEEINEKQKTANSVNKYLVLAIDYGYDSIVSLDSLYRPLVSHLKIERQACRFKLNQNVEKYSKQNFLNFLRNILKKKLVSLEISDLASSHNQIIYGDLKLKSLDAWVSDFLLDNRIMIESLSLKDSLPRYLPCAWPDSLSIPYNVEVSYQEQFNYLWVQFEPDNIKENIKEFTEQHEKNLIKNLEIDKIEENRPCLCVYPSDMNLYRAQILDVNYLENTAKVTYIDFGNSEEIDFSNIYELDAKYLNMPIHAIRCKLKNIVLDQTGIADLEKYKEDIHMEVNECFETEEKLFAIFSKPKSTGRSELDVEIYVNNPHGTEKAYLAYQTLIDKNRIEIQEL